MKFEVGDCVGFIYGQPGNDTTYLRVEAVDGENLTCWDLMFDMEVKLNARSVWYARDRELDASTSFHTPKRNGIFTTRQLLQERAALADSAVQK